MTEPFTCPEKRACSQSVSEVMAQPDPLMSAVLMCRACLDEVVRRIVAEQVVVVSRQEKTYKPHVLSNEWRKTE